MKELTRSGWVAEDGTEFDDESECRGYEVLKKIQDQIDQWLNGIIENDNPLSDRTKRVRSQIVRRWIEHDVQLNPERYAYLLEEE